MIIFRSYYSFVAACLALVLFIIPMIWTLWAKESYFWFFVYVAFGSFFAGGILAEIVVYIKRRQKRNAE